MAAAYQKRLIVLAAALPIVQCCGGCFAEVV